MGTIRENIEAYLERLNNCVGKISCNYFDRFYDRNVIHDWWEQSFFASQFSF